MQHAEPHASQQLFQTEEIGHGFQIRFDVMEKERECSASHLPPALLRAHTLAHIHVCLSLSFSFFDLQAQEATCLCTGSAPRVVLSLGLKLLSGSNVFLNSCQTDFEKPRATFASLKLRQRWNTPELNCSWLLCFKNMHRFVSFLPLLTRTRGSRSGCENALCVSKLQQAISRLKEKTTIFEL